MSLQSGVLKGPTTSKVQSLRNPLNLQSNSKARYHAGLFLDARYEFINRSETPHTPLSTFRGEWVTTRHVAINPLKPTKTMPRTGPVSQSTGLN